MEMYKMIIDNRTRCKIYSGAAIYKLDEYKNECNVIKQYNWANSSSPNSVMLQLSATLK